MIVTLLHWIGYIAAGAGVVVLAALAFGYFYFRRSLPEVNGTDKVVGLNGEVEIIRDVDGVPHIYAKQKLDAYCALGYVHAQDRLWQMEFQRRFASGQVAEVLGRRAIPLDRIVRTIGMHRAAASAWSSSSAGTKEIVEAYTAGINAVIRKGSLAPEFKLFRVTAKPWTACDVLVCTKLMAWNLGGTYMLKMLREELIKKMGRQAAEELLSDTAVWMPPCFVKPGDRASDEKNPSIAAMLSRDQVPVPAFWNQGEGAGSNNWVVSGKKSTSRKPMLAADPHLAFGMPSSWYLAHVNAEGLNAIGATFPGIPGVIMGRNNNIAWGLTNTNGDVQDLYYERLSEDGKQVEFQGNFEPLTEVTEKIVVRGKNDVEIKVRITKHGPLISDAMNANAHETTKSQVEERQPMALRWTALQEQDTTLQAFLAVNEAGSWEEFNQALRHYVVPPVNFGYADKFGNIGYCIAGCIPIRKWDNTIPCDGWKGDQEWESFIPFEQMPRIQNPEENYLVTANTRLLPENYPYSIGPNLVEPYRHRRIAELLQGKEELSVQDHADIQGDFVSLHAEEFLPLMLGKIKAMNAEQAKAIAALSTWDCKMTQECTAGSIFVMWFMQIPRLMFSEQMGEKLLQDYSVWITYVVRFIRTSFALNDKDMGEVWQKGFELALADLKRRLGADMDKWHWGRLHKAVHGHQLFGMIPGLKNIFSRSVPHGGDWSTVNAGGNWSSKRSLDQVYGANYRQVIDLSDEDNGMFIQSTGQSGHFLSRDYARYVQDWASLRYRPMRFRKDTVEKDAAAKLRLEPLN